MSNEKNLESKIEILEKTLNSKKLEKHQYELDRDNIELIGSYDLIFIDAAKAQYIKFFNLYEGMLNEKGIIVTDNLMFHGLVNNSEVIQSKRLRNLVKKIEEYNDWLSHNDHYHTSFLTIGDGIAVSVKI